MQISLIYFGQQVAIPKTAFELGIGFITIFIDGSGFSSASNDVGTIGYVYLNVGTVDVPVDAETAGAFANLHGQVVQFRITPSKFIRDGGVARFELTIPANGDVAAKTIDFTASNIRGVSLTTGSVEFSTEMLQLERSVAELDESITEDDTVAISDAAPADGEPADGESIPV